MVNQARAAIERLYNGTGTIWEHVTQTNPNNFQEESREIAVVENQPCHLSVQSIPAVSGSPAAQMVKSVKLFLAPEITVNPGSRITVTQDGITADYARSGVAAVYSSHQEIQLELLDRWP